MRKILIMRDSHQSFERVKELALLYKDYIKIHLGDFCVNEEELKKYGIIYVDGNCDFYDSCLEQVLEINNHKILITHGHKYNVKNNLLSLYYRASELSCDMVFYGHTHFQTTFEVDGIKFLNPGALKDNHYALMIEDKIILK